MSEIKLVQRTPQRNYLDEAYEEAFPDDDNGDASDAHSEKVMRVIRLFPDAKKHGRLIFGYSYGMYDAREFWISLFEDKATAQRQWDAWEYDHLVVYGQEARRRVAGVLDLEAPGWRLELDRLIDAVVRPGQAEHQPDRVWVVRNRLTIPGVGLVIAPQDKGKTAHLLSLSKAIADPSVTHYAGEPVMDHGGVLFFAVERPEEIRDRVIPLGLGNNLPFTYIKGDACPCLLDGKPAFDEMIATAKREDNFFRNKFDVPLRLIVIDSYTEAAKFEDRGIASDSATAQRIMRGLRRVSTETEASLWASAYFGKDTSKGMGGAADTENLADAIVYLLSGGKWFLKKVKGDGEGTKLPFELERVVVRHDAVGPVTTVVVKWVEAEKVRHGPRTKGAKVLQAIIDEVGEDQARAVFYERCGAKSAEAKKKAYQRAAADLGLLTSEDDA